MPVARRARPAPLALTEGSLILRSTRKFLPKKTRIYGIAIQRLTEKDYHREEIPFLKDLSGILCASSVSLDAPVVNIFFFQERGHHGNR
jgi:hypothetical protein